MRERPIVVKQGGNSVAMVGILAIVVLAAVALFMWQPWNTGGARTTNVIVQPGAQGGAGNAGAAGSTSGTTSGGGASNSGH